MTHFHIGWTLLLLVVFIGIVVWAWSGRRRGDFADAARLPLEQDSLTHQAKEEH